MFSGLFRGIIENDHGSIAKAITLIENDEMKPQLLSEIFSHTSNSIRVGITGPPGAGKSTLTNALIEVCLENKKTAGVVAVDPSSPFTGGALLGGRIRMNKCIFISRNCRFKSFILRCFKL